MSAPDRFVDRPRARYESRHESRHDARHEPACLGRGGAAVFGALMVFTVIYIAAMKRGAPTVDSMVGTQAESRAAQQAGLVDAVAPGADGAD
jgi:hypothetical protein